MAVPLLSNLRTSRVILLDADYVPTVSTTTHTPHRAPRTRSFLAYRAMQLNNCDLMDRCAMQKSNANNDSSGGIYIIAWSVRF
jgi:hypothetical protein